MSFLPVRFAKEVRELLPWWVGIVLAILACTAGSEILSKTDARRLFLGSNTAAALVYFAGTIALGALSIGHEYTHRTLAALLAQPIDRRRVLLTKLAVLTPMLVALAAIAAVTVGTRVFTGSAAGLDRSLYWAFLLVPLSCGLFLAPWLTMACRGPLPGLVFSIAIPGALVVVGKIALDPWPAVAAAFPRNALWPGTLALAAVGGLLTWRTFRRLEANDGPHAEIEAPGWLPRLAIREQATTRVRSRLWLLLRKELRLQQMTLVLSGLHVAGSLGLIVARRLSPAFAGPTPEALAVLHGAFIAVVAGALASAQERQLAVADWQALLPIAAWKQWAVKTGLAIALALVLAFGLPAILAALSSSPNDLGFNVEQVMAVVALCVAALYVSSLSTSGVRALLASFPAIACGVFIGAAILQVVALTSRSFRLVALQLTPFTFGARDAGPLIFWTGLLQVVPLVVGLVWLLLSFGAANHRSADRGVIRVGRQVGWIVGYGVSVAVITAFVSQMLWAGFRR